MGCEVIVEIDKHENGGTFTNYDIVNGIVRLTTTSSISLSCIQVKLEGIATTQMVVPKMTKNNERRDRLLQDVHRVLYDSVIVFPPENVRNVSSSKDFTLGPGNHTYPFQFKIPLNSSCIKMKGITNKVLFNKNNFNVMVNNGNFSRGVLKNAVNKAVQGYMTPPTSFQNALAESDMRRQQQLHVETQLPPSLSQMGEFAKVRYYVKVTCKRSSLFKMNLRGYDPFIFLPLDMDRHNRPLNESLQFEEYKEEFYRKEMVFRNRYPDIVGVNVNDSKKPLPPPKEKGLFSTFTRSPDLKSRASSKSYGISPSNVPFSFEVRFRHPAFLVPASKPSFRLYLISFQDPARYSLAQYGKPEESNGLGVVYLQKLIVELRAVTYISVLETDGYAEQLHQSKRDEVITLCNNTYENLEFDLLRAKKLRSSSATTSGFVSGDSYELQIPRRYFENLVFPSNLAPSFETCNITRKYSLAIVGGFLSERVTDFNDRAELERKVRYADLACPEVKVLSGLKLTSWLHSNASGLSVNHRPEKPPPLPEKPSTSMNSSFDSLDGPLPTYDDVVRESLFQDNSEHQRARRRYHS